MRSMRVTHLTLHPSALDVRIFHKECRSLARAGYAVTVVGAHDRDETIDGVKIRAVRKAASRWSRLGVALVQVCREALRFDADLYHFHEPELIPIGLLLRSRGKQVIYDVHEDYPALTVHHRYAIFPGPLRRPIPGIIRRLEDFAAPRLSAIVTTTGALAERFAALNPNCVVVHNFPETGEWISPVASKWENRSSAVAYVGTFALWRGVEEMVLAMAQLPQRLDAHLLLAGPIPVPIRDAIARLPGRERVQTLGVLDRKGVSDLLARVKAGLIVFHPLPHSQTAYPIKLFEYMAAGIPVIGADFPLYRELLGQPPCGLLVDPLSPKAIARAIEYVLTHPCEAQEMGRRGRQAIEERYNWSTEERKLLQLYEKLRERRG
jgi:glycosyltransferase involved in cell wall biosynthesis